MTFTRRVVHTNFKVTVRKKSADNALYSDQLVRIMRLDRIAQKVQFEGCAEKISHVDIVTAGERLFQTRAAATGYARSPIVR